MKTIVKDPKKTSPAPSPPAVPAQAPVEPPPETAAGKHRTSRADRAAVGIFGVLAVLHLGVFAYYFPLSIIATPFGDMMEWVRGYYAASDQGLLKVLWEQHNEHRLVFPKLLVIGDVLAFRGAIYPVAILSVLLLVISAWAIVRHLLRYAYRGTEGRMFSWWAAFAVLILLFPTSSLVNYSYPKNSQVLLVCFFALWAAVFLVKSTMSAGWQRWVFLPLALAAGICASLSSLNGLVVWFGLAWIAWRSSTKPGLPVAVVATGALTIAAYLAGHHRGPVDPQSVGDLLRIGRYAIEFLGLPWVNAPNLYWVGCAIGVVIIYFSIRTMTRGTFSKTPPSAINQIAVAMLMFALMTAAMTAVGRFKLDLPPAHRYGLYTITAYLSLFVLALPRLADAWRSERKRTAVLWGGCILAAALLVQQIAVGRFTKNRAEYFTQLEQEILNGNRDPAVTFDIFPDQRLLDEHYRIMREHRIYMFSD